MSDQKLPMAGKAAPPPPLQVESSSVRLVATLAVAGALAGLAIVTVFQWANPRIEAWRAEVLAEAVTEVLAGADRYETLFVEDGRLTPTPAADTTHLDRVYLGYAGAEPVGIAMVGAGAGFQDVIRVIFGYHPGTGDVIGMQVLESKETPGLGDKIEKDSTFIREFTAVQVPLVGAKAGRESGADSEVVMITGATISSRAIIDIINARLEVVGGEVNAYWSGASAGAGPASVARSASRPGGAP
jgi:electron transport complex protein RnfG